MSIRIKLFALLLTFSLIPLLVLSVISRQGIQELGQIQSDNLRADMIKILTDEMHQSAKDSAKLVQQQAVSLEFALKAIGAEAEDVLNDPVGKPPKVYFSEDFNTEGQQPADFGPSPQYFVVSEVGQKTPSSISLEEPVFFYPGGKKQLKNKKDLARLCLLKPDLKTFFNQAGTALHRVYITLNSGLHMAYPGHGNYPANFDPRDRSWFTKAVEHGVIVWDKFIDASTGQQVYTLSKPIRNRRGKTIGVVAIDIQLVELLRKEDLKSQWSSAIQAFVVGPVKTQDGVGLRIWAEAGHKETNMSWMTGLPNEVRYLQSSAKDSLNGLINSIAKGESGVMRMPYNGIESVWAFAPFRGEGSYVLITPERVITRVPDRAANQALNLSKNLYVAVGAASFLTLITVGLVAFIGSRKVIKPLLVMTDAAEKISEGDFSVHVDVKTGDERETLANAFNHMIPKLQDHLRISKSMELAQEVHTSLLPQEPPQASGLDISGTSISCDETGGDYFDFYTPPANGGTGILLGDVTGHGVSAALLMTTGRAHLKHASGHREPLENRIAEVNKLLCSDIGDTGRFMTLFCLEISPDNSAATYVRAGHDPATIYNPANGEKRDLMGSPMLALGIFDEAEYNEFDVELNEGEIIFIGTDGIWEARNTKDEMFGRERLDRIIFENAKRSAAEIQQEIIAEVYKFQDGMEQEDDITLVIIKVNEFNKAN
ncbi:SpoIIE family protein phosphatase [Maridesulfovibrio salexigens]|uniref:Protein serine/threonine phosphatase n=1 Tax=Maridesulfovibrio salexigens (strain ATCC 14822 / DSM 2638 / NCIMB 8403 / VKM B-1763) TaxID=526222 RepID=C6BW79_MARSD|nr:SpoIIE family protein phosphatase [Maridesulfovibrio salexigens]ACS78323.1 protein serine/threonine phosphatase [Maridesulfovibrio salexigens DSM 2638]